MILPSYNSIIGEIYTLPPFCKANGTLEHPIELALYSNMVPATTIVENLYVEPHILKECQSYIQKIQRVNTISTTHSMEGCLACIRDKEQGIHSQTISSKRNQSNFLTTIETDLVPHNVTTFSFVSQDTLRVHPGESGMSSPRVPESLELFCRM